MKSALVEALIQVVGLKNVCMRDLKLGSQVSHANANYFETGHFNFDVQSEALYKLQVHTGKFCIQC